MDVKVISLNGNLKKEIAIKWPKDSNYGKAIELMYKLEVFVYTKVVIHVMI